MRHDQTRIRRRSELNLHIEPRIRWEPVAERDNGFMDPDTRSARQAGLGAVTGARVGGISGALVGGGFFVLTGWDWWIVIAAAAGAAAGWVWARGEVARRQ